MRISLRSLLLTGALSLSGSAYAETVTLEQAIQKAVAAAPIVQAKEAAVSSARAGRTQAGVKPNPVVEVEAENFIGSGPISVLEQAEITATYNQTIERGGKRAARVALADSDIAVAEAAIGVTRLELAAKVQSAFDAVLLTEVEVDVAKEASMIARGLQLEADKRVAYAKDPLFVGTAATTRSLEAKLNLDQAHKRYRSARDRLAAFWGATGDDLLVRGDVLAAPADGVPLAAADRLLAEAEIRRASTAIVVEQTRKTQDYTVGGGARFLRETNDVAVVANVSIPLGRNDRNEGNIARAQSEKLRLELEAKATELGRMRSIAALEREAAEARARAMSYRNDIYPLVTKRLAQVQAGYARGGFSFRDMEDAADAIFDAHENFLEALSTLRATQAQIDRLTGRFDTTLRTETGQ